VHARFFATASRSSARALEHAGAAGLRHIRRRAHRFILGPGTPPGATLAQDLDEGAFTHSRMTASTQENDPMNISETTK